MKHLTIIHGIVLVILFNIIAYKFYVCIRDIEDIQYRVEQLETKEEELLPVFKLPIQ